MKNARREDPKKERTLKMWMRRKIATRSWERQGGETSEQKKILCNRLGHLFRWGPVGWRVEMAAKCTSVALNGRWSRGTGIYGGRRKEGSRQSGNHELQVDV